MKVISNKWWSNSFQFLISWWESLAVHTLNLYAVSLLHTKWPNLTVPHLFQTWRTEEGLRSISSRLWCFGRCQQDWNHINICQGWNTSLTGLWFFISMELGFSLKALKASTLSQQFLFKLICSLLFLKFSVMLAWKNVLTLVSIRGHIVGIEMFMESHPISTGFFRLESCDRLDVICVDTQLNCSIASALISW